MIDRDSNVLSLLGSLPAEAQSAILNEPCMKYPLVIATEPYAKKIQEGLMKCAYFDAKRGRFIRTKITRGARKLGPMGCLGDGYIRITVISYSFYQSHLVNLWLYGSLPLRGEEMDHIDGDTANDCPSNLRLVSQRNKTMTELTQEEVKRLFDYNPETGNLIWRWRGDVRPDVNSRCAGKIAKSIGGESYPQVTINGKTYAQHQIIWLWVYGYWPKKQIDHINRVRYDNRIINLREASSGENKRNVSKRCNNSTGVTGVFRDRNKYRSVIGVDYEHISLGSFPTIEEAIEARKAAEEKYFGDFRHKEVV